MSASIGISMYPDNATDIDTLIQQADAAMYKAKQAGRSTFRFFSADMDRLAEQRLAHSAALRQRDRKRRPAIAVSAADPDQRRRHHGVEALARWYDPELGEVSPSKFIPLAEEVRTDRADRHVVDPRGLPADGGVARCRRGHSLRVGQPLADQFPEPEFGRCRRRRSSPAMACRRKC